MKVAEKSFAALSGFGFAKKVCSSLSFGVFSQIQSTAQKGTENFSVPFLLYNGLLGDFDEFLHGAGTIAVFLVGDRKHSIAAFTDAI